MTPILYPYDGQDAAADWRPVVMEDDRAPRYNEWNAMRLSHGLIADTFEEYIAAMKSGERWNHVQASS